jgi:hypothetical protein
MGSADGQSNNIETALAFFGSIGGLPACISNLYAINSDNLKPIPGALKICGKKRILDAWIGLAIPNKPCLLS